MTRMCKNVTFENELGNSKLLSLKNKNKYVMSFGNLIYQLTNECKTIIRHIEQTTKKLIKAKYALAFNKTCINENILPKYSNLNIYIRVE